MQKSLRLLICVIFVMGVLGLFPQSAKAQAYTSYVSGITIANLSSNTATVTVTYYRGGTGTDAGSVASALTEDMLGNAILDYAAIPVNNFNGAVVISSSQPIAAISTLTGGAQGRGSYVGSSTGSKQVLLPFLAKNHGSGIWNTFFAVQNIGLTDTTVQVAYSACNSGTGVVDESKVVKPGASVTFSQKVAKCANSTDLPQGITSAKVTSTVENILAVVDQESTVAKTALVSTGFAAGTTDLKIPLVNANNPSTTGWRTVITIMNVGDTDTTVKLTYQRTDGTTCYEQQLVPAQKSKGFAGASLMLATPPAGVTTDCVAGAKLVGAAYIADPADNSAAQPLVAIINQDKVGYASAYGSFAPTQGTPKVIMPLIMDRNGGGLWTTSFNVMNVGDNTTYVKCTFGGSTYTATSPDTGLAKNGVFESLQGGKLGGIKKTTAECTAYTDTNYNTVDTNAKIIAVVNERAGSLMYDGLLTYEATNTTVP